MDFIVLKRTGSGELAEHWEPVVIVRGAEDAASAVTQCYSGDGRYRAIEWPAVEDSEFDVKPGPPTATPVTPEEPPEEAP